MVTLSQLLSDGGIGSNLFFLFSFVLMFWQEEGGAEGMNAFGQRTGEPEQTPGLVGSKARQSTSPFPLCFAQNRQLESS